MLFIFSHLIRGDISEAALTLGRSNQINYLKLAAKLAKLAGHTTFATSIEARVQSQETNETEEQLSRLPTRIEALLNTNDSEESESEEEFYEEMLNGKVNAKVVHGNCTGEGIVGNITEPKESLNGNVAATTTGKVLVGADSTSDKINNDKVAEE